MENLNESSISAPSSSKPSVNKTRRWRRLRYKALHVEQLESRIYLASDLSAGDSALADEPTVVISLQVTDLDGNAIESLRPGQDFLLHVLTDDKREDARGVFAAYLDVHWNSALAAVTEPLQFSETYSNVRQGSAQEAGLVDEAGACAFLNEVGAGQHEIFAVALRATAAGDLIFSADAADGNLVRDVLLYGRDQVLPGSEVSYGSLTIPVKAVETSDEGPDAPAAPANSDETASTADESEAPVALTTTVSNDGASDSTASADLLQLLALSVQSPSMEEAATNESSTATDNASTANAASDDAQGGYVPGAKAPAISGAADGDEDAADAEDLLGASEDDSASLNLLS